MDEGWTRFVFDTFNVPYSSVRDADIRQGGLHSKFDVLLFTSQASAQIVGGNAAGTLPAEFTGGITDAGVNNLKEFVNNGGTLVCFDDACDLAIKQFNLPVQQRARRREVVGVLLSGIDSSRSTSIINTRSPRVCRPNSRVFHQ